MRRLLLLCTLLSIPAVAIPPATVETLVLTSATQLPVGQTRSTTSIVVANYGPNDIWCAFTSAAAVANKSQRVKASGGTWSFLKPSGANAVNVWCVASTANQVTGAATVTSEIPLS